MRVLLNCKARGNPRPTISWVREDGKKIKTCRRSFVPVGVDGGSNEISAVEGGSKRGTKAVRRECREGEGVIIKKSTETVLP